MLLTIAVDYGARTELRDGLPRAGARGRAPAGSRPSRSTEDCHRGEALDRRPSRSRLGGTDGGELRLSNFLLYQCAYAELWSTLEPWRESTERRSAAQSTPTAARERRFGS